MATDIRQIISSTENYNLHAHTQFCDGRDSIEEISREANEEGMKYFGFTPHSPVPIESPCNMLKEKIPDYFSEINRQKDIYEGKMEILTSLEIDYLSRDFGPHIDYFQKLDLDYRLGSVHFVPNQKGIFIDCDGKFERFNQYLKEGFAGDLRYVVEKYFEQVLTMLENGGIDLLGHFDKIAGNASMADPEIENHYWYEAYIDDIISHVKNTDLVVEINTKTYAEKHRFFPSVRWWSKLIDAQIPLAIDSDVHYADKVSASRKEAFLLLNDIKHSKFPPSRKE